MKTITHLVGCDNNTLVMSHGEQLSQKTKGIGHLHKTRFSHFLRISKGLVVNPSFITTHTDDREVYVSLGSLRWRVEPAHRNTIMQAFKIKPFPSLSRRGRTAKLKETILATLKVKPALSLRQLAYMNGLSSGHMCAVVKELFRDGLVIRTRSGKETLVSLANNIN